MSVKIAPSLLSADFACIADQIRVVEAAGASYLHLDVMDGRFVPNITWGPKIIGDLRKISPLPFDCHLMIVEPEKYVDDFRKAGADIITVHYEATVHLERLVAHIKSLGAKAGVSINPATPIALLDCIIDEIDLLLVMSVNPGFGGQSFIPTSIRKLREARALIDARNPRCELEVDGGISVKNARDVRAAGANVLVMGSSIFGAADPGAALRDVRAVLDGAAVS